MMNPRVLAALTLTLLPLVLLLGAGCGEDSLSPLEAGADGGVFAEADDLAPDGSFRASTEGDVGVPEGARSYEIVLENLTPETGPGSSQPFSPPVIAVHDGRIREDAVNGPLVDRLRAMSGVADVIEGSGVIVPGATDSWVVSADRYTGRLSMVFMLVNTNDGFAGTTSLRLPQRGEVVRYLRALDAGSEENTELTAHIPGPCCGSPGEGIDTMARIRPHSGILGVGDLDPMVWDWDGPVAKLTIRALD
jgi:hypothetical protein